MKPTKLYVSGPNVLMNEWMMMVMVVLVATFLLMRAFFSILILVCLLRWTGFVFSVDMKWYWPRSETFDFLLSLFVFLIISTTEQWIIFHRRDGSEFTLLTQTQNSLVPSTFIDIILTYEYNYLEKNFMICPTSKFYYPNLFLRFFYKSLGRPQTKRQFLTTIYIL